MEKEGFLIDLDDIPGSDGLLEGKPKEEKKEEVIKKEPPKVEEEEKITIPDGGLITVDVAPEPKKEEKEPPVQVEEKLSEEKKEEIDDKSKEGKDAGTKETESPSFLHATALRDKGILPNLDLESLKDKDDEAVIDATLWATQDEIEIGVANIVKQNDEAYQEFIDLVNSGADIGEYARIKASQKRFDGVTDDSFEENEDLQKEIVAEDMKDRGYDDDDISDTIADWEEKEGRLLSKAKIAVKRINKRDTQRQKQVKVDADKRQADSQKDQKATMERIDSSLAKVKEIIPGIPLSKNDKVVVKKLMTVPIGYEGNSPISRAQEIRGKDPVAYETKLAYYIGIGLFDDVPKWGTVLKRANSDAAKQLMKTLRDTQKHTPGKTAPSPAKEDTGPMQMPFK